MIPALQPSKEFQSSSTCAWCTLKTSFLHSWFIIHYIETSFDHDLIHFPGQTSQGQTSWPSFLRYDTVISYRYHSNDSNFGVSTSHVQTRKKKHPKKTILDFQHLLTRTPLRVFFLLLPLIPKDSHLFFQSSSRINDKCLHWSFQNRVPEHTVTQKELRCKNLVDFVTKLIRYLKWRYSPMWAVCKAYVRKNHPKNSLIRFSTSKLGTWILWWFC